MGSCPAASPGARGISPECACAPSSCSEGCSSRVHVHPFLTWLSAKQYPRPDGHSPPPTHTPARSLAPLYTVHLWDVSWAGVTRWKGSVPSMPSAPPPPGISHGPRFKPSALSPGYTRQSPVGRELWQTPGLAPPWGNLSDCFKNVLVELRTTDRRRRQRGRAGAAPASDSGALLFRRPGAIAARPRQGAEDTSGHSDASGGLRLDAPGHKA